MHFPLKMICLIVHPVDWRWEARLRWDENKIERRTLAQNHITSFLFKSLSPPLHFIYSNIYTCDRWRRHFVPQIIVPSRHTVYQTKNTATLNKQVTCVSFLSQHLFTILQQFECITPLLSLLSLSDFDITQFVTRLSYPQIINSLVSFYNLTLQAHVVEKETIIHRHRHFFFGFRESLLFIIITAVALSLTKPPVSSSYRHLT